METSDRAGNGQTASALSDLLRELPGRLPADEARLDELIQQLHPKSYPIIMLVLAFPNLVPIPAPGLSAVVGLPLAVLMMQMTLGYSAPVLPQFLARRKIRVAQLRAACVRAIPYAERLEALIRPRLLFMLVWPLDRLIGVAATALSLIIMLPIPFGNAIPAAAICLIALGMLRGDGLTILAGFVVAAAGIFFIVAFAGAVTVVLGNLLGV